MAITIKNVFISHVHEDDACLKDLKDLLHRNGMSIRDSSITSDKENNAKSPTYIKNEILAPQIEWASTLIVYISPETKNSKWVDWEIEYAQKHDKTIIGIWEHGEKGCEIPEALDQYAEAVVGWNAEHIIDAINGKLKNFEDKYGKRIGKRSIKRHPCS